MNSKLTLPKSRAVNTLFPKWLMIVSAVVSIVLWLGWGLSLPNLSLTMATQPRYFPEAPLWHIGLYVGAIATMGYPIIGFIGMRAEQILAAFHRGLDLVLNDRLNQGERS